MEVFSVSKKKKNKVKKLSEVDYGNYIMSLKDETPVKPTDNGQDHGNIGT